MGELTLRSIGNSIKTASGTAARTDSASITINPGFIAKRVMLYKKTAEASPKVVCFVLADETAYQFATTDNATYAVQTCTFSRTTTTVTFTHATGMGSYDIDTGTWYFTAYDK